MKNTVKTKVLKGALLAVALFAGAAFCEVSYGSLTDTRDGKTYKTVRIGTQTWMAENLNYAYSKGTARSYCYGNDPANCEKYGRLYTWAAAMDSAAVFGEGGKGCGNRKECSSASPVRGVCPEGWHLPSKDEWNALEKLVADSLFGGRKNSVGYALKSASGWKKYKGKPGNGSDAFGFGALPAGYRDGNETFGSVLGHAYFWHATESGAYSAYFRYLNYYDTDLVMSGNFKDKAMSVRCVKGILKPFFSSQISYGKMTDSRDGKTYKTVQLGLQTWMAENLNYAYSEGTARSYCYDNDPANCEKYGRLYTWAAAMDSATVFGEGGKGCGSGKTCSPAYPAGWHLPSDAEWNRLKTFVADFLGCRKDSVGSALKSRSWWGGHKYGGGSDVFGFGALPAGGHGYDMYSGYHSFNLGSVSDFWSASEDDADDAYYRSLKYGYMGLYTGGCDKDEAMSIRCVKNTQKPSSSSQISYGKIEDVRDGKTYKTVQIGSQTWMAENLNYAYSEGTARSFCYGNDPANCEKYGRLYTWAAAMDSAAIFDDDGKGCGVGKTCPPAYPVRGVCPAGWHLPSNAEWDALETLLESSLGKNDSLGYALKSASGWEYYGGKLSNGSDAFGFGVLPAGHRYGNGTFVDVLGYASFWCAMENGADDAYFRSLYYYGTGLYTYDGSKLKALSVRCVKDP